MNTSTTKKQRLQPSLGESGNSLLGFGGEEGCVQEREREKEVCVCVRACACVRAHACVRLCVKEIHEGGMCVSDTQVSLSGSNRDGSGHFWSRPPQVPFVTRDTAMSSQTPRS